MPRPATTPTRGRPPAGPERAAAALNLRITPEQRAAYEAAAERDRRSISDWARLALDDAAAASETEKRRQ